MGVFAFAAGVVRVVPGGELPARVLEQSGRLVVAVEAAAMRMLADRLLAATGGLGVPGGAMGGAPALAASAEPSRPGFRSVESRVLTTESPAAILEDLLARSVRGNPATGQADWHLTVLRQLVPDEARILATLAAGEVAPTASVMRRGTGETLLANASLIGRTAAVTLPSRTPAYVSHLLRLGLVELGPEDPTQKAGYELLLADRAVREALRAGELGKLPAKVVRRTLRLSPAGRELWSVARPGDRP